jgi:hypothetical protein
VDCPKTAQVTFEALGVLPEADLSGSPQAFVRCNNTIN